LRARDRISSTDDFAAHSSIWLSSQKILIMAHFPGAFALSSNVLILLAISRVRHQVLSVRSPNATFAKGSVGGTSLRNDPSRIRACLPCGTLFLHISRLSALNRLFVATLPWSIRTHWNFISETRIVRRSTCFLFPYESFAVSD
jgi:hypothetical protein